MTGGTRSLVLDTNCMIALVAGWHEQHNLVASCIDRYLATKHRLAVAAHSLLETYAVLTRLPAPYRVAPAVAHELIRKNFGKAAVPSLTSSEYWRLLLGCKDRAIGGGRSYDALLACAASKLVPCVLLTSNARHFGGLEAPGVTIVEPA